MLDWLILDSPAILAEMAIERVESVQDQAFYTDRAGMPKRTEHNWKESNREGETRFLRAVRDRGVWRLSARMESEEFWENLEPPTETDLRSFRDVLWRKYQRRRVPWEHVLDVDKALGDDVE